MTPDRTKKVNLILQVLLATIPFGGLYAHYRIAKIRRGILINILSVFCVIIPSLFLMPYAVNITTDDTTWYSIIMGIGILGWFVIPYYFLIRWSVQWNKRIDEEHEIDQCERDY